MTVFILNCEWGTLGVYTSISSALEALSHKYLDEGERIEDFSAIDGQHAIVYTNMTIYHIDEHIIEGDKKYMWKQVKFQVVNPDLLDKDSDNIYGGIAYYYEDDITNEREVIRVICGCCGSEFDPQDVMILDVYDEWIDLTKTIISE